MRKISSLGLAGKSDEDRRSWRYPTFPRWWTDRRRWWIEDVITMFYAMITGRIIFQCGFFLSANWNKYGWLLFNRAASNLSTTATGDTFSHATESWRRVYLMECVHDDTKSYVICRLWPSKLGVDESSFDPFCWMRFNQRLGKDPPSGAEPDWCGIHRAYLGFCKSPCGWAHRCFC